MEVRMEFYMNILQDFAAASENILAVFTGRKFMLVAKVKVLNHYISYFRLVIDCRSV